MEMIEHGERSIVIGSGEHVKAREIVMHRRGEDVMGMAMRRNPELAACSTVVISTEEAFVMDRAEEERRTAEDIPRDERRREEWEWQ